MLDMHCHDQQTTDQDSCHPSPHLHLMALCVSPAVGGGWHQQGSLQMSAARILVQGCSAVASCVACKQEQPNSHWMEGSTRNSALSSSLVQGEGGSGGSASGATWLPYNRSEPGQRTGNRLASASARSLAEGALFVGVVVHHHPAEPLLGQLPLPDLLLDAAGGQQAVDEDLHRGRRSGKIRA